MFYRLAQIAVRIYFTLYHRVSIRGLRELEEFLVSRGGSPVILAANHASYLDPPAIGMVFPRPLRFIAWDGLFRVPLLSSLIRALGAVPVNQEDKSSAARLLRAVIGFIEDGFSVLIFPEGMRSPDGNLLPLEGGVALIALKTGAPIVPVRLDGTWEAYPVGRRFPRPRKVSVSFGPPIRVGDLPPGMTDKERRKRLLDSLEAALISMRGPEARTRPKPQAKP
ncbi:MAG: 1-acyl-sn-glycerol-3-phosphate acyltransferase [Synergistaceae bacterium]|jgi:1-acyl-sn-glycerol-3-phosphate acyltransferase|nr:1-acyl-sn-glycerol-3-phosphate acyltransferase [Synergistaceae bacterium]